MAETHDASRPGEEPPRGPRPRISASELREGEHGDGAPRREHEQVKPAQERPPTREDPSIVGKPSQAEGDRETVEEDLRNREERDRE